MKKVEVLGMKELLLSGDVWYNPPTPALSSVCDDDDQEDNPELLHDLSTLLQEVVASQDPSEIESGISESGVIDSNMKDHYFNDLTPFIIQETSYFHSYV